MQQTCKKSQYFEVSRPLPSRNASYMPEMGVFKRFLMRTCKSQSSFQNGLTFCLKIDSWNILDTVLTLCQRTKT